LNSFKPPPLTEQLIALTLAVIGGLGFVREAVSTNHALLPYPPELLQPAQQASVTDTAIPHDELFRGNLSMGDKYNQSLAWDRITQDRLRAGEIPVWTRDIASGVPFVPQMGQVYHPLNLLLLALPSVGIYGIWYLLHMALMGFFAYRFMRRIQISHQAALLGMVCVIAGFWLQARVHHNVMLSAALPVFAMLSCTHHILVHQGRGGHIVMLALATGLSWISGFAPASLLCTYLTCAYAVMLFFTNPQTRRLTSLLRFAAAIALGLLLATAHLGPVVLAAMETSRGPATPEILAARSLEWSHLSTAVWPTVFSWPGDHFYPDGRIHNTWASLAFLDKQLYQAAFNYPETAFYIGLIPLCLVFTGLRDRRGWLFAGAGLFGLAMALGILLPWSKHIPGAHSGDLKRFLLLFGLCMPVVAAMGLDRVLRSHTGRLPFLLLAIVGVHSLELGLLHLYPTTSLQSVYGTLAEQRLGQPEGTFKAWIDGYPGEGDANRWHLLQSFLTAAAVCILGCLALLRVSRFTAPILILVTLLELLYLGQGSIVTVANDRVTTPPAILGPVLDAAQPNGIRPRLQRLMPPTDPNPLNTPVIPNMAGFWGVEDLAGYSPLPNGRMEEFFLALEPNDPGTQKVSVVLGGAGVRSLRDPSSLTHPLSNLIGIEWILTPLELDLPNLTERTPPGLSPSYRLYQRSGSLPRATFVHKVVIQENRAERLATLADRNRDLQDTVVLETEQAPTPSSGASQRAPRVTITKHADEVVVIEVDTPADGYLRLADPYDAGWTAKVDGASTTVYPADHYFRAVYLEAGKHQVVFRYDGIRVQAPQWISLGAILGLFLTLWLSRRHSKTLGP
jgi:hypothetical protein